MQDNHNSSTESKLIKKQQSLSQLSALPLLASRIIPDFDASSSRPTPPRSLTPLSAFVAGYIERNETFDWDIFQEWFVEGVIGLDSRLNLQSFQIPLVDEDVLTDETGTIRITCFGENGRIPPNWCQSVGKALKADSTYQKLMDSAGLEDFMNMLTMNTLRSSQDASPVSFLQAPCFRRPLIRLKSKFQDRENSSSHHLRPVAVMEEESPSIGFSTPVPQLFQQRPAGQSIGTQGVASEPVHLSMNVALSCHSPHISSDQTPSVAPILTEFKRPASFWRGKYRDRSDFVYTQI
ncbi:hypothetical protein BLNAU_20551 [Blattamonas nauphoetae]|uniref:Uncharacterized protein n=1 Tax=Blattamonas nauphoetae TaxID=2049346 RepID=A0ABQ9X2M0_9EUKA|nr:hypothetical protein BLNAU_20551 [Blattamonas nauphoetae]